MRVQVVPGSLLFLSIAVGCKVINNGGSDTSFSDEAKAALNFSLLTDQQKNVICSKNPLFILTLNGEETGKQVFPGFSQKELDLEKKADRAHHDKFIETQNKAAEALNANLAVDSCTASHPNSIVTLATIADGPEMNDTAIRIIKRKAGQEISNDRYIWDFKAGALVKSEAKFELNMAKDLPLIYKAIIEKTDVDYSSLSYFIKSHGYSFLKDGKLYNALLYDTHGPEGEILGDWYAKVWSEAGLDTLCLDRGRLARDAKLKKFCDSKYPFEKKLSGDKSPGSGDKSPGSGDKSPGSGDKSPGSGDKSPGSGDVSPGSGDVSPGSGDAFSPDGSVLSFVKPVAPELFSRQPSVDRPQGYSQKGHAASYNFDQKSNFIHGFELPALPGKNEPILVVLDSCAQANLKDTVLQLVKSIKSSTGKVPVIPFWTEDGIYYHALQYDKFEGTQYRALPYVMYWGVETSEAPSELRTPIVSEMASKLNNAIARLDTTALKAAYPNVRPQSVNLRLNSFVVCSSLEKACKALRQD